MNTELTALDLRHALVQVVEEALCTSVADPEADVKWSDEVFAARLQIYEPWVGTLILVAVPDWCTQMAASFEGLKEPNEESIAKRADALQELLNMICGIVVSEGRNLAPRSRFGLPRIETVERRMLDELIAHALCHVTVETERGDPLALLFMRNTMESS